MIQFFYDSYLMFIQFLIPGIFLGIIYDIFRLIRIGRNSNNVSLWKMIKNRYFQNKMKEAKTMPIKKHHFDTLWVFAEDICFFLIVAITEILAIYHLNDGEIRIYCLLFSLIGFSFYQKTIGLFLIFFLKNFIRLLKKYLFICICIILNPTVFILKKSRKFLYLIKLQTKKKIKKIL